MAQSCARKEIAKNTAELHKITDNLNNQSEMFVNDSFTDIDKKRFMGGWMSGVDRAFNAGIAKEKLANLGKKLGLDDEKVENILKTENHPFKVLADNLHYNYRKMDNNIELDARRAYSLLNKYDEKDIEAVFDALSLAMTKCLENSENLKAEFFKKLENSKSENSEIAQWGWVITKRSENSKAEFSEKLENSKSENSDPAGCEAKNSKHYFGKFATIVSYFRAFS